jgi:hypothetical protein
MHVNHPVALRQLTEQRAAELRAAAASHRPRAARGARRWRRLVLGLPRRASVLRAPTS